MGDYKMKFFDPSDRSEIGTVVLTHKLNINNVSHATRLGNKEGALFDYTLTDGSLTINNGQFLILDLNWPYGNTLDTKF